MAGRGLLSDLGQKKPAAAPSATATHHTLSLIASNVRGDTFVLGAAASGGARHNSGTLWHTRAHSPTAASEVTLLGEAEKLATSRITAMSLNADGDRLLLSGPDVFAVVFLTPGVGEAWTGADADGDTATVIVEDALNTPGALRQVTWHPHCPHHLLALAEPNAAHEQLRLYGVSGWGVPPSLHLEEGVLPPVAPGTGGGGGGGGGEPPLVAFCFGGAHGWERFAVLALRSDGSAAVACPVLPPRMRLPRGEHAALERGVVQPLKALQQQGGGGSQRQQQLQQLQRQEEWLRRSWGAGAGGASVVEAAAGGGAAARRFAPCWQTIGGAGATPDLFHIYRWPTAADCMPSLTCLTSMVPVTVTGGAAPAAAAAGVPPTLFVRCFSGTPEECGFAPVYAEFLALPPGAISAVFADDSAAMQQQQQQQQQQPREAQPQALSLKTVDLEIDGSQCGGCPPLLLPDDLHGDTVYAVTPSHVVSVRAYWLRPALQYLAAAAAADPAAASPAPLGATVVADLVRADGGGVLGATVVAAADQQLSQQREPWLAVLTSRKVEAAPGAPASHLVLVNLEDKRASVQNENLATLPLPTAAASAAAAQAAAALSPFAERVAQHQSEIRRADPVEALRKLLSDRADNPSLGDACPLDVKTSLASVHEQLVEPLGRLKILQEETAERAAALRHEEEELRLVVERRGAALRTSREALDQQKLRREAAQRGTDGMQERAAAVEARVCARPRELSPAEKALLAQVRSIRAEIARIRVTKNQYRRQVRALTAPAEEYGDGGFGYGGGGGSVAALLGPMSAMGIGGGSARVRRGRLSAQERDALQRSMHEVGLTLDTIKRNLEQSRRLADLTVLLPS
jgi:hypothetical protein